MGSAGMDQELLEQWKLLSGICTIPKIADDVFKDNLDFFPEDRAFDNQRML